MDCLKSEAKRNKLAPRNERIKIPDLMAVHRSTGVTLINYVK